MTQSMDGISLAEKIEELVEPLCLAENMELVHVECVPAHGGKVLRIFMDKPGGFTIDDCVYMSRQIGDIIDVYGPILENIEVLNYKGVLFGDEVIKKLQEYDVLVLPTFWETEGYPGIILEAFSLSKPVISTNFRAIPEFVDHEIYFLSGYLIQF